MAPRAFVSYSHDSPAHAERVLQLAQHLRSLGVDAWLDRFEASPPEGWPRWMQRQIELANKLLIVCTPTYRERFEGREEVLARGRGVTWEGFIVYQMLYNARTLQTKCLPLLFDDEPLSAVPLLLSGCTIYRLPSEYDHLLRALYGRGPADPAPLGVPTVPVHLPAKKTQSVGARDDVSRRSLDPELRREVAHVLAFLGSKRVLFAEIEHELWTYVFPSIKGIVGELRQLQGAAHALRRRDVKEPIQFLVNVLVGYLSAFETDFERFMGSSFLELAPAHRERNWPLLGKAASELIRVRAIVDASVHHLNALIDEDHQIDWPQSSMHCAHIWAEYGATRPLCSQCGWNMYYAYDDRCPRCWSPNGVFLFDAWRALGRAVEEVMVAGSFSQWQPVPLKRKDYLTWIHRAELPPGRHTYKFIVDGQWMLDPSNTETETDSAGNVNSVRTF